MDIESVAVQHDARDVLAYVMNVSLYCSQNDFGPFTAFVIIVHERFEYVHGVSHDLG